MIDWYDLYTYQLHHHCIHYNFHYHEGYSEGLEGNSTKVPYGCWFMASTGDNKL